MLIGMMLELLVFPAVLKLSLIIQVPPSVNIIVLIMFISIKDLVVFIFISIIFIMLSILFLTIFHQHFENLAFDVVICIFSYFFLSYFIINSIVIMWQIYFYFINYASYVKYYKINFIYCQ